MEFGEAPFVMRRGALIRKASFVGLGAFVLLAGTLAMSLLWTYGRDGPVTNPTDFRAFYCAGEALRRGENPYRVGPLRRCQRAVLAASGLRSDDRHILFAPLPPYAIAVFALIARVPFRPAAELWLASSMLATGFIALVAFKLSRVRAIFVALSFAASIGFASLIVAQLVPFALLGLIYAAWCARRSDGIGAAIGATIGAVEPHLALPVWIALALFVPVSRVPLSVAGALIASLSFTYGGLTVEYFASVVPAHARSELYNVGPQYSLSTLLAALGVPARMAMEAGASSYALALAGGTYMGARLRVAYEDPAIGILAPLAAVVLGGSFIHIHQIAAALPLALMLLPRQRTRSFSRIAVLLATVALAVPWESVSELPFFSDRSVRHAGAAAPILPKASYSASVEVPYTAFVDAFARRLDRRTLPEQLAVKLPTWTALVVILAVGARARKAPANALC